MGRWIDRAPNRTNETDQVIHEKKKLDNGGFGAENGFAGSEGSHGPAAESSVHTARGL